MIKKILNGEREINFKSKGDRNSGRNMEINAQEYNH